VKHVRPSLVSSCRACRCRDCSDSRFWWPEPGSGRFSSCFSYLPKSGQKAYALRTMVQSQELHSLTVSKLAATAGVGVETIRFYQRRGLLETPDRDGGIRRYGNPDVRRLRFIRHAQAAGFTLDQIGELIALDSTDDRPRARELAAARVQALDEKIAELQRARDALQHLARECGRGSAGPCPILTSFET
jgi:MerR family mercuric resistance operon transcriptional regulator